MNKYVIPVVISYVGKKKDWVFDNQQITKNEKELSIESIEETLKILENSTMLKSHL